jgi:hypothetical protein
MMPDLDRLNTPLPRWDGKAAGERGSQKTCLNIRIATSGTEERPVKVLRVKKGHPRIESFIGPGIFVSPDEPALMYCKEVLT